MKKPVIVALAVLALAALGYWIYRQKPAETTLHQVRIVKGNPPRAVPDPVVIRPNDEIEWSGEGEWEVNFKDSPFASPRFDRGNAKSGKPTKRQGTFKYAIKVDGIEVDPTVIIKE